ncbi:MAG TPA: hypothetical protein VNY83_05620 [Solirubrobacterales bacterium]|jgi:hypothetical protein|nr:hypothetical protein [Solirubrobacterales bacterium]
MPSRPTPAEVSQLRQPDAPEQLEAELAREKEEVLRLRDLLITRDAELGAARGRLAMIEQGSQRLANAAARIPIPGATRLLQGMIRLLQRVLR